MSRINFKKVNKCCPTFQTECALCLLYYTCIWIERDNPGNAKDLTKAYERAAAIFNEEAAKINKQYRTPLLGVLSFLDVSVLHRHWILGDNKAPARSMVVLRKYLAFHLFASGTWHKLIR